MSAPMCRWASSLAVATVIVCGNGVAMASFGDYDSNLCPQGPTFSGSHCLPLGAQIAFVIPFWLAAWVAIFEGFGVGFSDRRGIKPKFLIAGIAMGLLPFFLGII